MAPLSMNDLLDVLDVVLLEQHDTDRFGLINTAPDWFIRFYPKVVFEKEAFWPPETFPFLENFLIDAKSFWEKKTVGRLKSGTFVEIDGKGNECALEASALCLGKRKILLLELLGTVHEERQALLQRARENILIRDYLEEEVRKRTADIRRREEEIALRLVWAAESRDKETGDHIRRIGLYAEALTIEVGWDRQQSDDIRVAATMHDIGKIGTPDSILQKPGKLTPQEYEIMKSHTEIGAKILEDSDVPLLQMAREIALCHHEKWDGSGYPRGLAGEAIPQSARIVTIADVYDALVHKRVYKTAKSEENTVAIMTGKLKPSFDPEILKCFLDLLPAFNRIRREFPGT